MSERSFSIGESFNRAWAAFSDKMGVVIGGMFIFLLISLVGLIPILGGIYGIVIGPVMMGGAYILVMNAVNRRQVEVADLFTGFRDFGTWLGVYWLLIAITFAAVIPGGIIAAIGAGIGAAIGGDGGEVLMVVGIMLGVMAAMIGAIAVALIWGLCSWVIADNWHEGSIITALKKSAMITRGHRGRLFLSYLLAGLLAMAGTLALLVGAIFTVPLAWCFLGSVYKELREIYEGVERGASETAAPGAPGEALPAGPRTWYYAKAGRSYGPYTIEEMRAYYKSGAFGPTDHVFCGGVTEDWVAARDVPEVVHPAPDIAPEPPAQEGGAEPGEQEDPDEGPIDMA